MMKIFALFILIFSALSPAIAHAQEEEFIPIPPRRPDVMNVSPEYIRELMKQKQNTSKAQNNTTPLPVEEYYNPDTPPAVFDSLINMPRQTAQNTTPQTLTNDGDLIELDGVDILNVLESGSLALNSPPIPPNKPVPNSPEILNTVQNTHLIDNDSLDAVSERMNAFLPAAGGVEQSVVSFMLEDEQIYLSENLKIFLNEYALKMFNENSNLVMDIQAYAPLLDGQEYSDVRVSLARALEVRSYLLAHNISPSRLKISPMGRDKISDVHNRIDLVFLK